MNNERQAGLTLFHEIVDRKTQPKFGTFELILDDQLDWEFRKQQRCKIQDLTLLLELDRRIEGAKRSGPLGVAMGAKGKRDGGRAG